MYNLMNVVYGMFIVVMLLTLFFVILILIKVITWMIINWNKKWE